MRDHSPPHVAKKKKFPGPIPPATYRGALHFQAPCAGETGPVLETGSGWGKMNGGPPRSSGLPRDTWLFEAAGWGRLLSLAAV